MEINTDISNPKVLVVDDNLINLKLVCAILRNHDIEYAIAENGKIAYNLYLTGKFNLILMDIQMPIMNGLECTQRIRNHEEKTQTESRIPIVAVTAFAMEHDKRNCFEAGVNEFIAKPFKSAHLLDRISQFIEIRAFA
ncbi:MAG: response regulator [Bacteroidetes bacterium]|nr:response regulator [Bacteroidota bacterium]